MKSNEDDGFIFLDLLGNELKEGDTAVMARSCGSSATLKLIIMGDRKKYNKIIKIYYQVVGKQSDRDTYFTCYPHQSGFKYENVIGIKNIEFELDKPEFARLFVKQKDFESLNKNGQKDD